MPRQVAEADTSQSYRGVADAARRLPTRGEGAIVQWIQPLRGDEQGSRPRFEYQWRWSMIARQVTEAEQDDLYFALGVLRGVAETTTSTEMRLRLIRIEQILWALIQQRPVS